MRIDPDLIAQIVNDMQDEPGALPLMQFALKDLFDARRATGGVIALTLNDYLARGGLRKALERHADAAFSQLNESEQQLARTIFSGLIEIGRGTQDTRRTAAFDELVPMNVAAVQVEAVIQKLADARLITTGEQGDVDTVTISHERLIGAWPWLQRLVNENREVIALQNQIAEDARVWDAHQRDASYLYAGARLVTAREQLGAKKIVLSGLAHTFVAASVEAEEAERQREEARRQKELDDARRLADSEKQRAEEQARSAARLRRSAVYLLGALGIALVLGVLAGLFGMQSSQNADMANRNAATAVAASTQAVTEANIRATAEMNANAQRDEARRQAAIADSRRLAALALASPEEYSTTEPRILQIQLARAAIERAHTDDAENALRKILRLSQFDFQLSESGSGPLRDLQFSPDGRRVAAAQAEGAWDAWIFDLEKILTYESGELASSIPLSDSVTSLTFTPDGEGMATLGEDGVIRIWDINTSPARERFNWTGEGTGAASFVYSPDGRQLLIMGKDSVPRVLDAYDGHVITVSPRLKGDVSHMAFSPDGKRIMTVAGGRDMRLWDATTGATLAEIGTSANGERTAISGNVIALHLTPDGERVLFVTDRGVLQQWMASAQQATVLQDFGFAPLAAAFSDDGSRLGMLGYYELTIYALDTGQVLNVAEPDIGTLHLAFSPDSQRLITFGYIARLWDARNGQRLAEIDGMHLFESGGLASVDAAFSPNGQLVGFYGQGYTRPMMRFEPVYIDLLLEWSRRLVSDELTCEQEAQYQVGGEGCLASTETPTP